MSFENIPPSLKHGDVTFQRDYTLRHGFYVAKSFGKIAMEGGESILGVFFFQEESHDSLGDMLTAILSYDALQYVFPMLNFEFIEDLEEYQAGVPKTPDLIFEGPACSGFWIKIDSGGQVHDTFAGQGPNARPCRRRS